MIRGHLSYTPISTTLTDVTPIPTGVAVADTPC